MDIVGFAIRVTNGSPVLFRQERVGMRGKIFQILKFQTMHTGGASDPKITVEGDKRITKIGKLLRKTKLDELPQLFNVLVDEMSIVGPRPEVADYVERYTEE